MRHLRRTLALAIAIATPACDDVTDPPAEVAVVDFAFTPIDQSVTAGSTLTWRWSSNGTPHNVTFEAGPPHSATQGSGSFERNFPGAGSYRYRCTLHSADFNQGMVGTVTVRAPTIGYAPTSSAHR